MFADSFGINMPTIADFKLPMSNQPVHKNQ